MLLKEDVPPRFLIVITVIVIAPAVFTFSLPGYSVNDVVHSTHRTYSASWSECKKIRLSDWGSLNLYCEVNGVGDYSPFSI